VIVPKIVQYAKHDYYPAVAQRLSYQGDVLIGMVIGVDGSTQDVTVLQTSGYSSLDSAAMKFYEEGRYATPVMLERQPVHASFHQTYRYRLQ
jgi:TonB family protein